VADAVGDVASGRGEGGGDLEDAGAEVNDMKGSSLTMVELQDLEARATAGEAFPRADAERVMACADLVSIGVLGEAARKAIRGNRVTFGRVCLVPPGAAPADRGQAGEVRLTGTPASAEDARARVRSAVALAAGVPLTGFSLADLLDLAGGDHLALLDLARALRADGLEAVAEVPIDRLGDSENAVEVMRAVTRGGLGAWRAVIDQAAQAARLDLIERASVLQRATGALRAFAPLARLDSRDQPSTGYDDVRAIAVARLVCRAIPSIQVDWSLYGPKLAQVAIAYGADDLDAVPALDAVGLGPRRSPAEDVRRQIAAAFAEPAERNGRYELRT
jgi:aminodeoxyfutalosine synthase